MNKVPKKEEINQIIDIRFSNEIHEKLKNAKVAVAGLGGLGSNIAVMLARSGIENIHIVDFDKVDLSNLNRQNYYIKHLGMKKTKATIDILKEVNPYLNIKADDIKINETNAAQIFKDDDIICEAFDDAKNKAMLITAILSEYKDKKIISGNGMAGFDSSNLIKTTKKMKTLYICGDEKSDINNGIGLMAPRVNICAAHQANMAIRLILGKEEV
ncbi:MULTISPECIES: sulfur carrier protein ThiS adenylyltransferase ThiF [Anaerofustis]|uniref:sulfur carrier protein ThiS adenylyltransferase ThiF n=1 Tax=Anaerofustis TaxID=264995 RepID=UPI00110601F3|nr:MULTISPECIES: sulfur carrier protein ThiS adenylyltransferase ThiF [Anaerofustis]MCO8194491.1 sulfur carrier protein ThiS adenylyltransferase ThiF [Anaerofustis sp. NSJ-163]